MRGTIGYFDEAAAGWTDKYLRPGHFRARLETVLSWLPSATPSARVLDYGCGSGVMTQVLLEQGFYVTGVDVSPGMLEAAGNHLSQKLPETLKGNYRLQLAENGLPTVPEEPYDGILCLGVLEYADNPAEILARFAEMLRPGGFLILSVPNRQSLLRGMEGLVHRHAAWFRLVPVFRHLTGDDSYLAHQRHQFTRADLARRLQALGLQERQARFHVAPGFLEKMAHHPALGMTLIARYERV